MPPEDVATAAHRTVAQPDAPRPAAPPPAEPREGRLTIGRAPDNDVVLDDPNVSRRHAELSVRAGGAELRDLGSRNGTRIDGVTAGPRRRMRLQPGAVVAIGAHRLLWDGARLEAHDDRGRVQLEAAGLVVDAGGRRILDEASVSVAPGELVAIIGRSGSGKTTLLRSLAGVAAPDKGAVLLNGEPIAHRLTDIGYVPQGELVHRLLTPREELTYAARLRLPPDVTRDEVAHAVAQTLERLSLSHRADTRIDRLSGGERRRAGVGAELLGRPSVLLLDEPTTGLDPGLERQTMRMLRELAGAERSVVVVTHATRSLELCDRLIVVGPGGVIRHDGPPRDALAALDVGDYDELYDAVEAPSEDAPPPPDAEPRPRRRAPGAREDGRRRRGAGHVRTLAARSLRILLRDRRNLAILLGQVPLIALAMGALYGSDIFSRAQHGNPNDAAQLLFLLVTVSIWFGALAAAREVVKERGILARERAIGVRLGSYLAAKCLVLGALVAVQVAALAAIVAALRPLHAGAGAHLEGLAILVAAGIAAVLLGLALSCASRSEDQATSWLPAALIPQLLFAGAIVPVSKMGALMDGVSHLALSRWAFDGLGTALDMHARIHGDPTEAHRSPYRDGFFDLGFLPAVGIIAAFALAFALLCRPRRTE